MIDIIESSIKESILAKQRILKNEHLLQQISECVNIIINCYENKKKVLLFGNGGSAADAQHIAGEFVSRFRFHRRALPALALNTNSSILTSIGNDYEYDYIFERQVEAFATTGDIVIGISTSGNSANISNGLRKAQELGALTIALLGKDGGKNKDFANIPVIIPNNDTPRIQECHIMIGHIICDLVEEKLFGANNEK